MIPTCASNSPFLLAVGPIQPTTMHASRSPRAQCFRSSLLTERTMRSDNSTPNPSSSVPPLGIKMCFSLRRVCSPQAPPLRIFAQRWGGWVGQKAARARFRSQEEWSPVTTFMRRNNAKHKRNMTDLTNQRRHSRNMIDQSENRPIKEHRPIRCVGPFQS